MGNAVVVDSMIQDGLWDAFYDYHMGNAAETVADIYKVTRDAQDAYAARSHQRAAAATDAGYFQMKFYRSRSRRGRALRSSSIGTRPFDRKRRSRRSPN